MSLFNNWMLLVVYSSGFLLIAYMIIAFIPYFAERIKAGVVSAFMLAMLLLFISFEFMFSTGIWIRISGLVYHIDPQLRELQTTMWGVSLFFVILSLGLLAYITFTKKFDLWFYLKKAEPDKSKRIEKMVQEIMEENNITPETIHKLGKDDENSGI